MFANISLWWDSRFSFTILIVIQFGDLTFKFADFVHRFQSLCFKSCNLRLECLNLLRGILLSRFQVLQFLLQVILSETRIRFFTNARFIQMSKVINSTGGRQKIKRIWFVAVINANLVECPTLAVLFSRIALSSVSLSFCSCFTLSFFFCFCSRRVDISAFICSIVSCWRVNSPENTANW